MPDHVAIVGLLGAYGFEVQEEDKLNKRTRFRDDETFVDVWETHKGVSMGIYSPVTKKISYPVKRAKRLGDIEDALIAERSHQR